jgi:hypothetical protein
MMIRTACCIIALWVVPAQAQPEAKVEQPFVHVDVVQRVVDVDCEINLREADWLELLTCVRGTREHEAILVTDARPSHVHLALMLLDLEPGQPLTWRKDDDGEPQVTAPTGPRIAVSIVFERDGETIETPANEWIVNQETGEPMDDNIWLFCGSGFTELDGRRVYRADVGGNLISLVNFGDDTLTRPTTTTNQNDNGMWTTNTQRIPPRDTAVRLRLRPAPEPDAPTAQPASP